MEFSIQLMRENHIAEVVALERKCELSSRGEEGYLELLSDEHWLLLVGLWRSEVIAVFSGLMVLDELQIDNVAVSENYRRKGIAARCLNAGLERALEQGMTTATLETRAGNMAAIKLYEHQGFIIVGRRKNYYHHPPDDALLMSFARRA